MTTTDQGRMTLPAPTSVPLRRGFLVATVLALLFLASTAYTSVVTLVDRIQSTDVMKAVSGDIWSAKIAGQMAYFGFAQILLHVAMGAVAWLLACACAAIWPVARVKFVRIIVGWFCLLAAATLAYNALWYPRTFFGAHYYDLMTPRVGPFHVGQLVYGTVLLVALGVLVAGGLAAWGGLTAARKRRWTLAVAGVSLLVLCGVLVERLLFAVAARDADARPNVILLGIDSLRLDELSRYGGYRGNTPHIDGFLAEADVVKDASTPMARTFGSWVAILTGRGPAVTGARNNLTPRKWVAANPTIADVLRQAGYRTVYATDEVRFANIDESYGFDEVITPPIGASDFIIGTYNELPLASVVINTRLGQMLFPFSYGNRGAAQVFEPKTYLSRLERELQFDQPTFLIVHLTAAHWPYFVADTPFGVSVKASPEDRPLYRIGLRTADSMFDHVISILRRKGAMDNAIVVVLSDHGEALSLPRDAIVSNGSIVEGLGAPLKLLDSGHGQSVLSPTQYKVLLAFKRFGVGAGIAASARDLPTTATVEDIAPTLLELLGITGDPLASTGRSLAPMLQLPVPSPFAGPERIRFTETDLSVIPDVNGEVDEVGTAKANSKFFGIDPASSRMHIRERMIPLVRAYKERAAFTSRYLLAALPAGPDHHQYLYFDIDTGAGRLLMGRPGPELLEGQRLWDALHANYRGELKSAARITRADWPVIENEWRDYLNTHRSSETGAAAGP
ncbi:MAG: sulfatase-like hydrolase/transferase [Proteobacteria bacterium]|nr:sulfatase-like hydrolase/transferase [Pseudomonadota bacterium]